MHPWQEKLYQGNANFHQQNWKSAETDYLEALQLLEKDWFKALDNAQLMMAWIATMHNLATLYEQQKLPQKASEFLVFPYRRIMTLIKSAQMPEEFTFPLLRALKCTVISLLEFSDRHPVCKCCQCHLDEARQWLNQPFSKLSFNKNAQNITANQPSLSNIMTVH